MHGGAILAPNHIHRDAVRIWKRAKCEGEHEENDDDRGKNVSLVGLLPVNTNLIAMVRGTNATAGAQVAENMA